jgi:membrane protease YdiL (CAAX protease family)
VLDRAVAELTADPVPWGWRPAVVPVGTLIALIVISASLASVVHPSGYAAKIIVAVVANFALEAVLVASVWWSARDITARNGGWGRTFGLRRPRWNDLGYAGVGILVIFMLRILVVGVADGLTHGRASKESQNIQVDRITVVGVILLVAVVVVLAPLVEESLFRGVLLRTLMRRMGFWPAAILSTAIFAGLHTYEVDTVAGALTLAGSVGCLGIVNCYLNRLTDRVFPGMLTHAAFNGLAVIVLVVQAGK